MAGILDPMMDPRTQGLLAAGFQGLQASGPSRMPVSLGFSRVALPRVSLDMPQAICKARSFRPH